MPRATRSISAAPRIPYPREAGRRLATAIGIYAYRGGFLRISRGSNPRRSERAEALEQLRALWHGYRIAVVGARRAKSPPGVDTPQDLEAGA